MPKKNTTNLANFTPEGVLGQLFTQARAFNRLNDQLSTLLPESLNSLSLCALKNNIATFVTQDQSLAFRAQKQQDVLLNTIKQLDTLSQVKKIVVKVDLKEY